MAKPANISPLEASESLRALGGAPWFDDTLRALARQSFGDGNGIAVPVTIAWGEKDRILPPRQAKRAARAIPSARMVTLWGCGHVPTYDDPEQVARGGARRQSAALRPSRSAGSGSVIQSLHDPTYSAAG